jgi:septum formation protein
MRLVLASASPRRAELLTAAGFTFETLAVAVDESIRLQESPYDYVLRLAAEKSARALEKLSGNRGSGLSLSVGSGFSRIEGPPDLVVLGADTAVVVDDLILGKPRDDREARAMLRRLSGRAHQVMTGVSMRARGLERGAVETTMVWFAPLSAGDVEWYVESGEGRDKAGAYAIQGLASRFIPRIEGSYSSVVGLPVARVFELLSELTAISGTRSDPSPAGPTG